MITWLDELEISTRARNLLTAMGITTRAEFDALEEQTFLAIRGGGRAMWREIEAEQNLRRVGVRVRDVRPSGYRICSAPIRQTEKAVLVGYYGWMLWLPKRSVTLVDGRVCAPLGAIERAKDFVARSMAHKCSNGASDTTDTDLQRPDPAR